MEPSKSQKKWESRMNELRQFYDLHGHCQVPARYPRNPKLGHWVMTQRRKYLLMKAGKVSSLSEKRIDELNKMGFIWKIRHVKRCCWSERLDQLVAYKAENGSCDVPRTYVQNPALGAWVSTQRRQYRLLKEGNPSTLTRKRIKDLENIGFKWRSPVTVRSTVSTPRTDNGKSEDLRYEASNRYRTTASEHISLPANGTGVAQRAAVPSVANAVQFEPPLGPLVVGYIPRHAPSQLVSSSMAMTLSLMGITERFPKVTRHGLNLPSPCLYTQPPAWNTRTHHCVQTDNRSPPQDVIFWNVA